MKIVRDFERKLAAAALARDPELSRIYDTRQLTLDLDELDDPARTTAVPRVPEPAGPGGWGWATCMTSLMQVIRTHVR